jgi:hypothetical protein
MDGITYPCVLSIERIPFTEGEVAGRLTKPESYRLLEKVSSPLNQPLSTLAADCYPNIRFAGHVQ